MVDKALAEDAPRARAEFLNIWREDLTDFCRSTLSKLHRLRRARARAGDSTAGSSTLLFVMLLEAPAGTVLYVGGGACREINSRNRTVVLDLVREHKPRFVPAAVVAEFAAILRLFGITEVQGDGFAGGFHADEWASHQIKFVPCERTTSENYLALLPLLLQPGRVRLCDSAVLRQQLAGLERRVHAGVRERASARADPERA